MNIVRLLRVVRQRLRAVLRKDDLDSELASELAFHLDQLTTEKIADGLTPEEARLAARREFGNPAVVQDRSRDQRRVTWIHDLRQDVLYGLRMLRRSPGFTAVALASLALGIGGNAAVMGAMHTVLIRDLPFLHGERLVILRTFSLENPQRDVGAGILDYLAWRDRARTLDAIGMSLSGPREFGAEPDGTPPESISGLSVTPGWFQLLGVAPLHGRLFDNTAADLADPSVIVISHRLWQQRFGGAPDIIGRHVRLNSASRRVVAVMPPGFRYLADNNESWIPLILGPDAGRQPGPGRPFVVLARLKPGVTMAQAQAELDAIAADLGNTSPERHRGWGVRVQPLRDVMYGWTKVPLFTLQAAVAVVLLITCTNVAGLSLARATVRSREIAVRAALGAGPGRIVRQLMAESVLLSGAGAALGLFVAGVGLRVMTLALGPPPGAPRIGAIGLDPIILAVTILLSGLSALAFGLAPALTGGRVDLSATLNASAPTAGRNPRGHRQRGALMAAQIALAVVLLVIAGLLVKSFLRLSGRPINMDPTGILTFEYSVPTTTYARQLGHIAGRPHFQVDVSAVDRVYQRVRELPGTVAVGAISYPPVNSLILPTAQVVAVDAENRGSQPVAYFVVTPEFFATMRTPVVRGRDFSARDTPSSPWVAVVNESMAKRFWPNVDPIGRRVRLDNGSAERDREVIGVVADIPTRLNQVDPEPVIYTPYRQPPSTYAGRWLGLFGRATFVVRHDGDPAGMLSAARRAVAEVDPGRPIVAVGSVERHLTARRSESRNYVLALAAFALTATLLSAIGLYGVTAYTVSERTREIGIRRTLGAGTRDIASLIGRRVLPLIGAGLLAGLAGAFTLARWISGQLWQVAPTDPATYAGVALLLAVVALLACLGPARRGLALNPTTVLRGE